jgi:hypothetical protein
MGKKRAKSHRGWKVAPAARDRGSEDEESESGDMSGTSLEKRHLAETREELREANQEALRLAVSKTETGNRFEANEDDDDDDDDCHNDKEEELETLRTQNAELLRRLQRKTGAAASKLSTWKPCSLHTRFSDAPSFTEPNDVLLVRKYILEWLDPLDSSAAMRSEVYYGRFCLQTLHLPTHRSRGYHKAHSLDSS